jgi:hypothetical protein
VLGAGSIGNGGGLRLGHFAAMLGHPDQSTGEQDGARWRCGCRRCSSAAKVWPGARPTCSGRCCMRPRMRWPMCAGSKDTSRQGRWHNARFKALAEELRIEVTKDASIGWSPTTIPAGTREAYAQVIDELGRVLRLHRSLDMGGGRAKEPSPPACVCECGRRIRVSPTVLAAGPITCGVCGAEFTAESQQLGGEPMIAPTPGNAAGEVTGVVAPGGGGAARSEAQPSRSYGSCVEGPTGRRRAQEGVSRRDTAEQDQAVSEGGAAALS